MLKLGSLLATALFACFCVVTPSALADNPQQQKMKDCNAQASER